MIHTSRDSKLDTLGKKGSGFFVIKLSNLYWSGNEWILDTARAQAYDNAIGARKALQKLGTGFSIPSNSLSLEELSIALADRIGFAEPNGLEELPLREWADYWARKAEVAYKMANQQPDDEPSS